jgi:uncharacterized membrane protein YkvA (DUF1232 family)
MNPRGSDLGTTLRFFLNPAAGFWAKLLFLAAIVYVILPFDFIPDVVVVVGWIDDLVAVLGATTALLIALNRYKAQRAAMMAQPEPARVPRVIDTEGSEIR